MFFSFKQCVINQSKRCWCTNVMQLYRNCSCWITVLSFNNYFFLSSVSDWWHQEIKYISQDCSDASTHGVIWNSVLMLLKQTQFAQNLLRTFKQWYQRKTACRVMALPNQLLRGTVQPRWKWSVNNLKGHAVQRFVKPSVTEQGRWDIVTFTLSSPRSWCESGVNMIVGFQKVRLRIIKRHRCWNGGGVAGCSGTIWQPDMQFGQSINSIYVSGLWQLPWQWRTDSAVRR